MMKEKCKIKPKGRGWDVLSNTQLPEVVVSSLLPPCAHSSFLVSSPFHQFPDLFFSLQTSSSVPSPLYQVPILALVSKHLSLVPNPCSSLYFESIYLFLRPRTISFSVLLQFSTQSSYHFVPTPLTIYYPVLVSFRIKSQISNAALKL